MHRDVVAYCIHRIGPSTARELRKLEQEVPPEFDMFVLGCCNDSCSLDSLRTDRIRVATYVRDELRTLPYPARISTTDWGTMRGSPDLTLMKFFWDHSAYRYYWFIEYDVRFTGNWETLFDSVASSDADILCANIERWHPNSTWVHWATFQTGKEKVEEQNYMMGFLPVCRVTSRALRHIDNRLQEGWNGHPEAVWLTALNHGRYKIEEIGGDSPFTPPERKGRYYGFGIIKALGRLGTFNAWPVYADSSNFPAYVKDVLWHPVKDLP
jgi:hypothetical protein